MLFNALLFLCLYLPFQLAINPMVGIDLASLRVLVLLIFFVWLAIGLKNKKLVIKNNWTIGLLFSFLFIVLFSSIFSKNFDWSARKIMYWFSIIPVFFVFSCVADNREKIIKIIKALVISGTVVASLGIIQFVAQFISGLENLYKFWSTYVAIPFFGESFSRAVLEYSSWLVNVSGQTYFRAIAVFPDPHMFSMYLGLLLPLTVGLFVITKRKTWLISAILILAADLLTFSRGGFFGLLTGFSFSLIVLWIRLGRRFRIALSLAVIAFILILTIPNPIASRFYSSFNFRDGSNLGRLEMWEKAMEVILDRPIFGTGIGNFPLEVNPLAAYREPIYAHNTYLDIAVESGILAAFLWMGFILTAFFKFLKKSKDDAIYLGVACSLIIFSFHSIFETGLYSPVVLTLLLIIISFSNFDEKTA